MADSKLLKAAELAAIIYNAVRDFILLQPAVTDGQAFDALPEGQRALFESQIIKIATNIRVKPKELHDNWKVTAQRMSAQGELDQDFIVISEPYMIPFDELPIWMKSQYRLQLQMVRTLLRHNKNAERAQKRER